jgi:lipopolysaccharide export system permease protein
MLDSGIVRILSRYFVARFLGLFVFILFAATMSIVVVEMLLHFDDMLKVGESASGVLTYLFLRIPSYYLRDLLPLTAFAAAFFAFGLAARWMELTAMKAGGVSPLRVALPVIGAAALLSLASFALSETLVVRTTQGWNHRVAGGAEPITFHRGSFWYHRGRTIYNIDEADREANTLRGLRLYELDDTGRLVRSVRARRVVVESDRVWRLEDAVIQHFDPRRADAPPQVEHAAEARLELAEAADDVWMEADPAALPLSRLWESIRVRTRAGHAAHRFEAVLHARLAEPFAVTLFALLAVPLGLRVETTRSLGEPALRGVIGLVVFFTLRNLATTLGAGGVVPAGIGPWGLLLLFGAWGAWRLARAPA